MWALLSFVSATIIWAGVRSAAIAPREEASLNGTTSKVNEYMDPSCSKVGGICVPESGCPEGFINEEGQCTQRQDYRCCQAIPITRTACQENGGECFDNCRDFLRINKGASSCLETEYCCLLLA